MERKPDYSELRKWFLILLPINVAIALLSASVFVNPVGAMISNSVYLIVCVWIFIIFWRDKKDEISRMGAKLIILMFVVYTVALWCSMYMKTRGG